MNYQTGMTNNEIGEFIGGLNYSGMSRVEEHFVEKLKKNRTFEKDLKTVFGKMSKVNGLLPQPHQSHTILPLRKASSYYELLTD